MSVLAPLVEELVVNGVRQSLSQSLAQALSGAASGSVRQLMNSGSLSGLNFNSDALKGSVQKAQQQMGQQPAQQPAQAAPSDAVELDPITVTGRLPSTGLPASALGQILGGTGSSMIYGGSGSDVISDANTEEVHDVRNDQGTEVAPVTVVGNKGVNPVVPVALGAAGLGALAAGAGGGGALQPVPVVDPISATAAAAPEAVTGLTPTNVGMAGAAGLAGAGLGGLFGTGVTAQQALAGAALAGALGSGQGAGSGGGTQGGLESIAKNNQELATSLKGVVNAGMAGDIGGRGLNSIDRMVRKAQAAIRARYSSMGMSGSTAEQDDLNAAAEAGVDMQFKVGQQMASTGLAAIAALSGQSAAAYASLLNAQTAKNTALGNALANFAGALVS